MMMIAMTGRIKQESDDNNDRKGQTRVMTMIAMTGRVKQE